MHDNIKGIAFSHRGNFRSNNEDSIYWGPIQGEAFEIETLKSGKLANAGYLAAVADGVGGCIAGEEASLLAINTVKEQLDTLTQQDDWSPERDLRKSLETAHSQIVSAFQADPSKDGMATTFTALFFQQQEAYLMHIGDSRCYRYSSAKLSQTSIDHSPVGEMVAEGRLSEEEAHIHPYRSYIDRVLGNTDKPIDPLIEAIPLKKGDRWLICSDGLSDSLYREQIEALFVEHSNQSIESLALALMDAALDNAGRDNISLAIIEIGNPSIWSRTRNLLKKGLAGRRSSLMTAKKKSPPG